MSREKDRQKQRLINLANFIEKNPQLYNHERPSACIVGLGNRLVRGKLTDAALSLTWATATVGTFATRYGVPYSTASNLFWGRFGDVNPKQKNWNLGEYPRVPVKSAVAVLRYLTK
jgi:hypothetical protein